MRGGPATVGAALLIGVAVCSAHYAAMSAVRVRLDADGAVVGGVSPFVLGGPVCVIAVVVIAALAYSTVNVSIRQETDRAEERLAHERMQRYGATVSS